MKRTTVRRAVASLATAGLIAGGFAATANAAPGSNNGKSDCAGRSVPASKISIQLFSYAGWQGQLGGPAALLEELAEIGYTNVEPYGGSYGGLSAAEYAQLAKSYGIKVQTAHGSTSEASWQQTLADAKARGQKYVGSGGFASPGIGSYENVLATAATMNRLGELSVKNGTGKLFGHNHQQEFTTQYADPKTGEMKSAWEILVENTDHRWVTFQLDTFWAADAGIDVAELIEKHGKRIELLHIKDGDLNGDGRGIPLNVGDPEGDMDWGPILKAAQGKVNLYVVERDGAPNNADFARESFEFLTCFTY